MSNIPTAEDFCKDLQSQYEETGEYKMYFAIDIPNKLKEFAKLHVKAALKSASKIDIYTDRDGDGNEYFFQNEKGILNAYPLTNIK